MEGEEIKEVEQEASDQQQEPDQQPDKPEGDQPEAAPEYVDMLGDDVPEWMDALDLSENEAPKLTRAELDALPAEAKVVLNIMRKQAREAARRREDAVKEARTLSDAAKRAREDVEEEQAKVASIFTSPEVQKMLDIARSIENGDKKVDYNDLSEDGVKATVEALVAQRMAPMLESITKQATASQQEITDRKALGELRSFADEHPDFRPMVPKIKELVKDRDLSPQEAYYLLKGQGVTAPDPLEGSRKRARAASKPGGGPSKPLLTIKDLYGKPADVKAKMIADNPHLQQELMKAYG